MDAISRRRLLGMTLGSAALTGAKRAFGRTDGLLRRLIDEGMAAGAAIRVARDGEALYQRSLGLADMAARTPLAEDAIFRAYSMTKPIAASAVMRLVEQGHADLDAPIDVLIPELANLLVLRTAHSSVEDVRPATQPVTLRRILTHTAGFTNNWSPGPLSKLYGQLGLAGGSWFRDPAIGGLAGFAARLAKAPLAFEPGTNWLYSMGFDLCGLAVERATGQTFGDYLQNELFSPLGMVDSGFFAPPTKAARLASVYARGPEGLTLQEAAQGSPFLTAPHGEAGASGLVTTLEDYGRFADMLAGAGARKNVRILTPRSLRQMTSSQVPASVLADALIRFAGAGSGASGEGLGFGLGGSVVTDPTQTRAPGRIGDYSWGGAASTTFFASPALGLSAVLMVQLFPSGTYPLHDWLKRAVFDDLAL